VFRPHLGTAGAAAAGRRGQRRAWHL